MENPVKVATHPKTGKVVTAARNNSDYENIRVEQEILQFGGGFANAKNRSAFINGKKGVFKGLVAGQILKGQIIVKEALSPFYDGQTPKTAGADGEVCTKGGKAIYRSSEYTEDMSLSDELIQHDNVIVGSTLAPSKVALGLAKK